MFIIRILRLLRGYVVVWVKGGFKERFLNLAVRKNIDFWNVIREGDHLTLCIRKRDFKRLRDIAKKSSCQISIQRKTGAPFFVFRYRKRTALFTGLGLFFMVLWISSLFLWSVEVVADEGINEATVLESLATYGIKSGTPLSSIRSEEVKNNMMVEFSDIAFIGINIKGTKAVVEVKKRDPVPAILPKDQPCNIVAAKTGQIIHIETKTGMAQAQVGQGVKQGQLLVSGILNSNVLGARYVHALAEVTAKTWYRYEAESYLIKKVRERTGHQSQRHRLIVMGLPINFYFGSGKPYETYDKMVYEKEICLTQKLVLPIVIETERYFEVEELTVEQTRQEAILKAQGLCDEAFYKDNPDAKMVQKKPMTEDLGDRVWIVTEYECEENIAKEEPIQLSLEDAQVWWNRQSLWSGLN
jgi:similar to stage IV sporulation protein